MSNETEQVWSDERISERAKYWQGILIGHANFDPDTWIEAAMLEVRDDYEARLRQVEAERDNLAACIDRGMQLDKEREDEIADLRQERTTLRQENATLRRQVEELTACADPEALTIAYGKGRADGQKDATRWEPVVYSTFIEDQSGDESYLLVTLQGTQLEIGTDPTADGVTVNLPSYIRLCQRKQ